MLWSNLLFKKGQRHSTTSQNSIYQKKKPSRCFATGFALSFLVSKLITFPCFNYFAGLFLLAMNSRRHRRLIVGYCIDSICLLAQCISSESIYPGIEGHARYFDIRTPAVESVRIDVRYQFEKGKDQQWRPILAVLSGPLLQEKLRST